MYGFNNYDPMPWFMMMNNNWRKPEADKMTEEDLLKLFRKFQDLKKEFEPKKDGSPSKKEGEWSVSDYLTFVVCFVFGATLVGGYFILAELIEFAKIIHAH